MRSGKRKGKRGAADSSASLGVQFTAGDIARLRNGGALPRRARTSGAVRRSISMRASNALYRREHDALATKVFASVIILIALVFLSLGIMGAQGQYYPYAVAYTTYSPVEVAQAIYEHAYNAVAEATRLFNAHTNAWILENAPAYWAVAERAGVVGITLLCAILLSVSGMLYQNVFKNPIASAGMLGAGSGVSLGMMLLVVLYGAAAQNYLEERYLMCYGFGAAILLFVVVAGKKLSGRGKPFDIVTMLLVGSVLSQLLGTFVSYMTLFVMDEEDYTTYYEISQMLVVDNSALSWIVLGIAAVASFVPIVFLRYRMNALAFDDVDARLMGTNATLLRTIALVCGAIMLLAAQIHIGSVSLVALIVPFLARQLFGCEFSRQLIGNVCIGTILMLACRDITDLIPFVGDGFAIGSIVSLVALPLFVIVMARQMRGWE